MRLDGGARWCEQHQRHECTRQRHHGRGDCHGSAVRGLDACRLHSGLTGVQARARGDVNLTLAALMSAAPRRHPAEILLDALHAADQLMLIALSVNPTDIDELQHTVEAIERAQLYATRVLGVDALDRLMRMREAQWLMRGDLVAGVIKRVCDRLEIDWRTPAIGAVIAEELRRDPDATPTEAAS
jgi:hypothetical protein